MKATEFELKMSDHTIPAYLRKISQKALSTLRVDFDGTIEVSDEDFAKLCKYANMTPINGRAYRFIRIFDELDNSVDIQTPRSFIQEICVPLASTFGNYPNPLGNI